MFCNNCGSINPDDAHFCSSCGRATTHQKHRDNIGQEERLAETSPIPATGGQGSSNHAEVSSSTGHNVEAGDGIFRKEKFLLVQTGADLPSICIRCGSPDVEIRKVRRFYWHNPWWFLLLGVFPIAYPLVLLAKLKRTSLTICLCSTHNKSHWTKALGGAIAIAGLLALPLSFAPSPPSIGLQLGIFLVFTIIAAMLLGMGTGYLKVEKIDDGAALFSGVDEGFLNHFPEVNEK